jgi:glycosyltransferase involved in cell wall biosynthesis
MKVLMHCVYFPPEVGGLESHVFYLCRALAHRGHEVHVVTSRSQPGLSAYEVVEGVHVWRSWLPGRNTAGWAAHAFSSMPRFGTLAQTADVLHAQDIAAVLPCMVAQKVRSAPIVTTYHTSHFLKRSGSPFWRPIFKRFLEAADHNLAASVEIAAVGATIAPTVHVEPLTNGVDTSIFQRVTPELATLPEGRFRLIVPRRLFEKNGVEVFVRALPDIVRELDVDTVVVGDGPERDRLQSLASELGVAERISFLGARANSEMPGLLSSADLAVFPSLMEATSVAALECMACGVPVAASRVGGLPEIVDEDVGGLFEPNDPPSLARMVVNLLESRQLGTLGAEARRRVVERWSNERLADRHVEIYEKVISQRSTA